MPLLPPIAASCDLPSLYSLFGQVAGEEEDETQDVEVQQLMKQ